MNGPKDVDELQDPELAPMLSPARYVSLLGMNVETLARNAGVSVSAITQTPAAAKIQMHLRDNVRVIKAVGADTDLTQGQKIFGSNISDHQVRR